MEPPKLTRKQEMGIDPIPPELMHQIQQYQAHQ